MAIDTIKSSAVLDGAIATADIADDAVTGAKIENNPTIAGNATISGSLSAKGGAVFNEDSGDHDFRVESNNDANILRIEAAQDNVKIGSNAGNYGILSIRTESAGAQERGLYIESAPASGTSPNNVAVFSAANANMTQPMVRIHHESPTADQLLLQATTTGSNTVKFSVDEDGDIYSAGGINLGGTGTANKLDDYEEGTFTPNIGGSGVAYGTQTGVYRKIGKLVYVYLQISINTIGSPATTSGILGLPFAPAISNQYFGITYATGLNSNYYEIHGNFRSNSEIRTDGKTGVGSGQNSGLSWAKAGAAIYGSGCYYTSA